jgi:hypothetical protein
MQNELRRYLLRTCPRINQTVTVQPRPSHSRLPAEGAIGAEALATVQYNPALELVLLELGNENANAAR